MAVERAPGGSSLIDVLDRILDKGIVIDAWVRISLVGIDLITVEARVVIASIDTYLKYAEAVGITPTVSRPALGPGGGMGGSLGSGSSESTSSSPTTSGTGRTNR
jgi:hypothetical protein